ncbi:MAG: (Fe-S)-binding protein [Verrucomicrobia bacterium]|nr:(Fe-S)-binding protein [Verrucomicrobiota bacterium]
MVERLQTAEVVVIPSGSCGAMLRVFYPEIFKHHPKREAALSLGQKTYELSEFLVDRLGVTDLGSRFPAKITFHDGCHGLRELHVKPQPRQLLKRVKELTLVEMEDQTSCCGFGGTFAVKFPMISIRARLVRSLRRTCAGCRIGSIYPLRLHCVEHAPKLARSKSICTIIFCITGATPLL